MFAMDSRSRPPAVVDDTSSRIYFNPSGASGSSGGGGFLSFVYSMCYSLVTSILQIFFAIFRPNVRPGKNKNQIFLHRKKKQPQLTITNFYLSFFYFQFLLIL